MSRIARCFEALDGKKALIPFITAGDPTPEITVNLMNGLVKGGADIIELGVPFSDPMADGPVIQQSSERALKQGMTLAKVLDAVAQFRVQNQTTPVVLMGYLNPLHNMGYEAFAHSAKEAGVDGVLVVDMPPEESDEFKTILAAHELDVIYLIAPTTTPNRVALIARYASGYVYYVSLKGVTGAGHLDIEEVARKIAALKSDITVPIGVGFGISDAKTAKAVAAVADAVVVGSRLVKEVEAANLKTAEERLSILVAELKAAIL